VLAGENGEDPPITVVVSVANNAPTCSLAPAVAVVTSSSRRNSVPNTYTPEPTCFRFSTLAAGTSYPPITLEAAVDDNAQPSGTNEVTVTGGGAQAPVTASDTTTVAQLPQLAVSSYDTAGGVPYAPFTRGGSGNVYDITVANNGFAATAGSVSFSVTLPAGSCRSGRVATAALRPAGTLPPCASCLVCEPG
jgi:hypothetical protein